MECISGWSVVLMACCLRELGPGRVIALGHQEGFARRTNKLLARYGDSEWADVVHAPIEKVRMDGDAWPSYGVDIEEVMDAPVNLLLMAGSPGELGPTSRYPTVPLLLDFLSDSCALLLDDGHQGDGPWIAGRWPRRLDAKPTFDPTGTGLFVWKSSPTEALSERARADGPAA